MIFRAIRAALLLSVLPAAGCGTVSNVVGARPETGGVAPFGGVRQDLWCIQKASSGEWGVRTQPKSESERYPRTALMLLCAADLPFSLVGDLVTWPYARAYSFINAPIPAPPVILVGGPVSQPLPPAPMTPLMNLPPVPQPAPKDRPAPSPEPRPKPEKLP
jgi:hypothetical protein